MTDLIPNQLDFMHKSIIPGVHEIAVLVAKIACVWWLGAMLPSVRIVRPESEAITFGENSSSRIAIGKPPLIPKDRHL